MTIRSSLVGFVFALTTSATVIAGGTAETAALTVADLRDAIRGQSVVHRGRQFEGDMSAAFADGYIFATAEAADRAGEWCGIDRIAPNELVSRMFERLSEADLTQQPADTAIRDVLVQLAPC